MSAGDRKLVVERLFRRRSAASSSPVYRHTPSEVAVAEGSDKTCS